MIGLEVLVEDYRSIKSGRVWILQMIEPWRNEMTFCSWGFPGPLADFGN